MTEQIADERLVALADGELPADEAAALRRLVADDPALAERYALFVETRALLEPPPEGRPDAGFARLASAIRAADQTAQATSPKRRFAVVEGAGPPRPETARPLARFRVAAPAMAACLALVAVGALGFAIGRGAGGPGPQEGVLAAIATPAAAAALSRALERAPSGDSLAWTDGASGLAGTVTVVSTHRLADGRLCREFESGVAGREGATVGLGCRDAEGRWRTELAARRPTADGDYAAASGASVAQAALEALGGGDALPANEERDLLASGWRVR